MDSKQVLEKYARGLGSTGSTRTLYLKYAKDFLDYGDGQLDRETIAKYMEHLRHSHHFSDGTVNFQFRIIRTMFQRNKLEWNFTRGEAPQIRENKVTAPALHPDTIIEMIQAVKRNGTEDEKAFLALSTTYGLRRVELVGIKNEDILLPDHVIHIATAKHGRERTHMVPEEIVPILGGYDFDIEVSEFKLFGVWYRLEHRIQMKHTEQVGWHSIRRTLNTLLGYKLPENVVSSFLRWKQRTSSNMAYRYSAQQFVGKEGTTTRVVGEALETDKLVFKAHPFISAWKD